MINKHCKNLQYSLNRSYLTEQETNFKCISSKIEIRKNVCCESRRDLSKQHESACVIYSLICELHII